jgi:hypothetical protein
MNHDVPPESQPPVDPVTFTESNETFSMIEIGAVNVTYRRSITVWETVVVPVVPRVRSPAEVRGRAGAELFRLGANG